MLEIEGSELFSPDVTSSAESGLRRVRGGLLGYGRIGQAVLQMAGLERDRLADAGFAITGEAARSCAIDRARGEMDP